MKKSSNEIEGLVQIDAVANKNKNIVDLSVLETYMNDFCAKKGLKIGQNLTNDYIYEIFQCLSFMSVVSFYSVQNFIEKYLKAGEKISFETLNLFFPPKIENIQDFTLKKLRAFIKRYIDLSKTCLSNMDDKIKEDEIVTSNNFNTNIPNDLTQMELSDENKAELYFLGNLFRYVKNDQELLDEKNKEHIKYFTDWQEQLLNNIVSKIMDENCQDINCLAAGLLKFKYETKQYAGLKDLQSNILQYIKSVVFYYGQSDRGTYALNDYLSKLKNLFDEDEQKEIFNQEFVQKLKNVILGKERKITKFYQIEFLRNILTINSKLNKRSYSFDEAYDFIFEGQSKSEIQRIVASILVNKPVYVGGSLKFDKTNIWHYGIFVEKFLDCNIDKNLNIDSEQFKIFCQIFHLRSQAGRDTGYYYKSTNAMSKMLPQDLPTSVNDYLSSEYFLPKTNIRPIEYANSKVKRLCYREFYLTVPGDYNGEQVTSGLLYQIDNKIDVLIKNVLTYKQNTYGYEILIGSVFLMFGFVSLAVLKSTVDILSLPIKVIINIFCSAIVAFKRKGYFEREGYCWMIILPLKELSLGVLFVIFSPIICLVNNFFGSKHLFHTSGSGRKLVTFNNWRFYNSKDKVHDFDNLKNFSLTDINLRFFIKYIFGLGCVVRLKKSEDLDLIAELKLIENDKKVDDKNSNVKVYNKTFWSYYPIPMYTNEYSPLRYFEIS